MIETRLAVIGLALGVATVAWAGPERPYADMVLHGGKVVTVDERLGEVEAVAIREGRIMDVGSDEKIRGYIGGQTRVIDLDDHLAIPGFIEGHGHFVGLGQAKMNLDLTVARSWADVVAIVAKAVRDAPAGEWIVGRGWHQEKWDAPPESPVRGFPTHHRLSEVSPEHPVLLTHASGHACLANRKAMDLAGVSGSTPDPDGGEILRDEAGQPTGVFNERAQALVSAAMGPSRRREFDRMDRAITLATRECLSKGVTSFQDAGSSFAVVEALARRARRGDLGVRLWVMIREPNATVAANIADYKLHRIGEGFLTVGGLKRSIDGALGSRGAWLLEPYADLPESTGLATASVEDVTETARLAMANDLQLCVHAIGDRANREVLDLCERLFAARPGPEDRRWRIEHAQHLDPADIPRFAKLGVIASMQGIHCTSDAPWVIARLGAERAGAGAYVWQKLMKSGAVVTNGTDAPVEDVSPIASYYASVTRRLSDGRVFFPDQRMSRLEALRSYTINAAYAAFEEDIKGSISHGKLADIVVLSKDILTIPDDEIPETKVLYTIVGGRVAWRAGDERKTDE